jgi:preprotein translocase subunit YajC
MNALIPAAWAQGPAAGPNQQLFPLLLMLAFAGVFYFLLIRPQQKKAKEHKTMLQALKKGDTVETNSGFIGRIVDIDDDMLILDLGSTRVQIVRSFVSGLSNARLLKAGGKKESKKDVKDKDAEPDESKAEAVEAENADANAPRDPDRVDKV